MTENQDGFRPTRSTTDSLTKLTNNIYNSLNINRCTTAIFLDFKKAFDTLDHKILSQKLTKIGFQQNSKNLIDNYLMNRKQSTKANGLVSGLADITCGVPQGSVLGPLLFLIYINDLHSCLLNLKCQHYADDTVIFLDHLPIDPTAATIINNDLQKISNWSLANKLSLNTKKTKAMTFTTKALANRLVRPKLKIGVDKIEYSPTYCYLGLTLDSMLTFKKHIDIVKRNAEHKVYLLTKVRKTLPDSAALKIVKSMILPAVDYSDIVYMTATKTHLDKIQQIIDKGVRISLRNKNTINAEKLRKVAKINLLADRRQAHLTKTAFVSSLDDKVIDKRNIRTRAHNARLIKVKRPKNPAYRKSLEFRIAMTWNSLDVQTRAIKDYSAFKRWLDKTLVDKLKKLPDIV